MLNDPIALVYNWRGEICGSRTKAPRSGFGANTGAGSTGTVRVTFEAAYLPNAHMPWDGAVPGGWGSNTRSAFGSVAGGSVMLGFHVGVVCRLPLQAEQFAHRFALAWSTALMTGCQARTISVYLSVSIMTQRVGADDGEKN